MEESHGEGIRRVIPFFRKPEIKTPPAPEGPRKTPFSEYLHVLETYAVQWDAEKTARDTWQNFFDANGYSVDNVKSSVSHSGNGYAVDISGPASYDYRYLLHTGGTTKSEDVRSAGGFGEGAKIAAFVCLRDFGAKEVVYHTGDKKVTFYLDSIQDSHYPKPVRGLFVRVEDAKGNKGSSFQATFLTKEVADKFLQAKDLFYHKENQDFLNPTANNEVGGFKIHVGKEGNLYEAGQRRHVQEYNNTLKWNNVEDATIWTWAKTFQPDRDRGDINKYQVENKAIAQIVKAMKPDEIKKIIEGHPQLWHESEVLGLGRDILQELCREYNKQVLKGKGSNGEKDMLLKFPDRYVSSDLACPSFVRDALKEQGYMLCDWSLADVGMITASEKFRQLQEHYKIEPTEAETKRIDLLKRAVKELLDTDLEEEVWMFSQKDEKNIIHGQYSTGRIWMAQEKIRGDFASALTTLLHERDHKAGGDQTAEFSYALTNTLEKVIQTFLGKADVARPLAQNWDSIKFS